MSPQTKRRLQFAVLYPALALGAIGWGARAAIITFDARYLHTATFDAYVADKARQHVVDSLVTDRKFQEVIDLLHRLDTTMRVCVRHQDTCR